MRNLSVSALSLTLLFSSCQPKKNDPSEATNDTAIVSIEKEIKTEQPKAWKDFTLVLEYIDKAENSTQKLGINWITADSIEYRLRTEDALCETDYSGSAKNKFPEGDAESDEDENGDSYFVTEYREEKNSYTLSIRISDDKDRAKINYQDKLNEEADCLPVSGLFLQ